MGEIKVGYIVREKGKKLEGVVMGVFGYGNYIDIRFEGGYLYKVPSEDVEIVKKTQIKNPNEYFNNEQYKRKTLKSKLEQEKQEYMAWLKHLIDLTYQDGVNAKTKIRIELKKKLGELE